MCYNEEDIRVVSDVNTEKGEQEDERQQEETHSDSDGKNVTVVHEKGRMWRMSDIMPVSLQDILHCGKPGLRKNKIRAKDW